MVAIDLFFRFYCVLARKNSELLVIAVNQPMEIRNNLSDKKLEILSKYYAVSGK